MSTAEGASPRRAKGQLLQGMAMRRKLALRMKQPWDQTGAEGASDLGQGHRRRPSPSMLCPQTHLGQQGHAQKARSIPVCLMTTRTIHTARTVPLCRSLPVTLWEEVLPSMTVGGFAKNGRARVHALLLPRRWWLTVRCGFAEDDLENKISYENYKIWKKHVPYLYDVMVTTSPSPPLPSPRSPPLVRVLIFHHERRAWCPLSASPTPAPDAHARASWQVTHALYWPSLTVQWLPDCVKPPGKEHSERRLIMGTHTSEDEPNYLLVAKVQLPGQDGDPDSRIYSEDNEAGGYGNGKAKVEVTQKILHKGEVNRARYMPQNPSIIATKGPSAEVFVFDYTRHPSQPKEGGAFRPDLTLAGHDEQG